MRFDGEAPILRRFRTSGKESVRSEPSSVSRGAHGWAPPAPRRRSKYSVAVLLRCAAAIERRTKTKGQSKGGVVNSSVACVLRTGPTLSHRFFPWRPAILLVCDCRDDLSGRRVVIYQALAFFSLAGCALEEAFISRAASEAQRELVRLERLKASDARGPTKASRVE